MLEFTVLVNTRNHPAELRECLNALETQSLEPARWEVLVVDDGSDSDDTLAVAENFRGRSACRALRLAPTGRAGARNAGIREARGERVLFIGDSTLAAPDLLQEHARAARRRPEAAILGSFEEASPMPSRAFGRWFGNLRYQDIRDRNDAGFCFFYTGNISVPREALVAAGGFDENFVKYGWEDLDLGLRLEKRGTPIVFQPRAAAVHMHSGPSLESLCRREYECGFSAAWFFEKWAEEPAVQAIPFWRDLDGEAPVGPPWRKALARRAIRALERLGAGDALLDRLYGRLVAACRLEGLRDGRIHYETLLEALRETAPSEPAPAAEDGDD